MGHVFAFLLRVIVSGAYQRMRWAGSNTAVIDDCDRLCAEADLLDGTAPSWVLKEAAARVS